MMMVVMMMIIVTRIVVVIRMMVMMMMLMTTLSYKASCIRIRLPHHDHPPGKSTKVTNMPPQLGGSFITTLKSDKHDIASVSN